MKARMLRCIQCGNEFFLSTKEQERLLSRGFGMPKRCPDCRRKKTKGVGEPSDEWRQKGKKRHVREKYRFFEEET